MKDEKKKRGVETGAGFVMAGPGGCYDDARQKEP
jgi:hypothetical protein